jgi:penicillin-binding protein 1C
MRLKHNTKHIFKNALRICLGLGALVFGALLIWVSTVKLPDFASFDSRKETNSTKIYDRTGTIVLYDLGSDTHRTSIPYTDMGAAIKNATVAIEDSSFYQHKGIRPKSMLRALLADITQGGAVQGGSTITQQVIKKSLLSDDKTLVRKVKEAVLAIKLEQGFTKDEILGFYLNVIPYGGNVYGIQEASRAFLGKNPIDLTIAEAAYLAAIPNAPTRFSPYGSHKDDLEARKNLVLFREKTLGFITEEEYNTAKEEKVTFIANQSNSIKAPHFVFFIKDYLEQKYGVDALESEGLKVISTLDYTLQQAAEKVVSEYTIGAKKQIEKQNAGLVAMDPKTGQILAMVGSRNYFDKEIDGNFNVTTARRQPGSSFKPYVYATAFKDGYTPETILFDVPTEFNAKCNPYGVPYAGVPASQCYSPQNYDGKFHGPLSIRESLARSMNIPAVKMLYIVGVNNAIKTAQDMGITTLTDPSRYGLSLVLGGGEVRLLEMVNAYGGFANEGIRNPYSGILSVETSDGNLLETWESTPVSVLPRDVALNITDILQDNTARTPTFGANSALYFNDHQVAVKTGTTNGFKDSWTIGYTPSFSAGVWVGKNDNTSMPVAVQAAPLWHAFMVEALKNYPNETFPKPDPDPEYSNLPPVLRGLWMGNESYVIDTISGKLATNKTPESTKKEYVITDVHDILHWVIKDNPRGGRPLNPSNESLYLNFETGVLNWWAQNSSRYGIVTRDQKPTESDDVHTEENTPIITLITPTDNTQITMRDTLLVTIQTTNIIPIQKIDVFLNNTYVGTRSGTSFSFTPDQIPGSHTGVNTLMITATSITGQTGSITKDISISQ